MQKERLWSTNYTLPATYEKHEPRVNATEASLGFFVVWVAIFLQALLPACGSLHQFYFCIYHVAAGHGETRFSSGCWLFRLWLCALTPQALYNNTFWEHHAMTRMMEA